MGIIIGVGIGGVLAIFILLKICCKFPLLNTILVLAAGIGIIVSSFAMPEPEQYSKTINMNWVLAQALCVFLYLVLACAEFAFEEEDYIETKGSWNITGTEFTAESKLAKRSMFWSVLGGGLIATVALVGINYAIFDSKAILIGIAGCVGIAVVLIPIIKRLIKRISAKRRYY